MFKKMFGTLNRRFGQTEKPESAIKNVPAENVLEQIGAQVNESLSKILTTDNETWRFVIEQFERSLKYNESSQRLMTMFPLKLLPVEYQGATKPLPESGSPAIIYIENQVKPVILENFNEAVFQLLITKCLVNYCLENLREITATRIKFALHNHQEHLSRDNFEATALWSEVIIGILGRNSGFVVGDTWLKSAPNDVTNMEALVECVARQLAQQLPTEQDVYWFVIEEYDLIIERGDTLPVLHTHFPLFSIEHEGRRSEESYVGKANPGVAYLDNKATTILTETYGVQTSNQIRAGIYVKFRELFTEEIDRLRTKYAEHYRANCLASGSVRNATLWSEVINSIAQ